MAVSFPSKMMVRKRATIHAFGGCGNQLNHGDCDAAVADLEAQLRRSGPVRMSVNWCWYCIRGAAVAFAWNPNDNLATYAYRAEDFTYTAYIVTQDCGWYTAGTYCWGHENGIIASYMILLSRPVLFRGRNGCLGVCVLNLV
jgi:hypothetical protein